AGRGPGGDPDLYRICKSRGAADAHPDRDLRGIPRGGVENRRKMIPLQEKSPAGENHFSGFARFYPRLDNFFRGLSTISPQCGEKCIFFVCRKAFLGVLVTPLLRHQSPEGDGAHCDGTRTDNTALSQGGGRPVGGGGTNRYRGGWEHQPP